MEIWSADLMAMRYAPFYSVMSSHMKVTLVSTSAADRVSWKPSWEMRESSLEMMPKRSSSSRCQLHCRYAPEPKVFRYAVMSVILCDP